MVGDAHQAIGQLEGDESTPPVLVLLDLKLPKGSGFDVLRWIRSQPCLSKMPVVILISSGEDRDREEVGKRGAAKYHVKPAGFTELVSLMGQVVERFVPAPART